MVPSLTLVRQFCPPDEDMAQVRGAPTPKSPSSRLKTGPWVFKTTGHNCSNPIHGGLEYKGKQEQQLKESRVKPHRTGCSLPEQVLVRDGRTEQRPCSTPCSSLQPQHSRDRDKGLSLHTWLWGETGQSSGLSSSYCSTRGQREVWGGSWQPWDTPTNPSSTAGERTASQIFPSGL